MVPRSLSPRRELEAVWLQAFISDVAGVLGLFSQANSTLGCLSGLRLCADSGKLCLEHLFASEVSAAAQVVVADGFAACCLGVIFSRRFLKTATASLWSVCEKALCKSAAQGHVGL